MIPNIRYAQSKDINELNMQLGRIMQELTYLLTTNLDDTNIADNGISASKLNIATLASIVADLGTITAGILQNVSISTSFSNIDDGATTLTTHLNNKATKSTATSSDTHNHGIPNGTVLLVSGGGTVTFNSYTHSHTQN